MIADKIIAIPMRDVEGQVQQRFVGDCNSRNSTSTPITKLDAGAGRTPKTCSWHGETKRRLFHPGTGVDAEKNLRAAGATLLGVIDLRESFDPFPRARDRIGIARTDSSSVGFRAHGKSARYHASGFLPRLQSPFGLVFASRHGLISHDGESYQVLRLRA